MKFPAFAEGFAPVGKSCRVAVCGYLLPRGTKSPDCSHRGCRGLFLNFFRVPDKVFTCRERVFFLGCILKSSQNQKFSRSYKCANIKDQQTPVPPSPLITLLLWDLVLIPNFAYQTPDTAQAGFKNKVTRMFPYRKMDYRLWFFPIILLTISEEILFALAGHSQWPLTVWIVAVTIQCPNVRILIAQAYLFN